jgi:hypothetical protein
MSNQEDKKSENDTKIQLQQGNNSLAIIGNTAPVDLNIRQTVHVHNGKLTPFDSDISEAEDSSQEGQPKQREWPDPKQYTVAKVWTKENNTFCLSTETKGKYDGKVEFALDKGEATKQMNLMMLLCYRWPKGVPLSEIIREIYLDNIQTLRDNPENAKSLLKKLRALVSDIRNKKLAPSGINPDIISPLGIDVTDQDSVTLLVAKLHR